MGRLPRRIARAVSRGRSRGWRLLRWHSGGTWIVIGIAVASAVVVLVPLVLIALHVYGDRTNLPDPGPFERFEFLAIGHVYDANDTPLIELAREHRSITAF